MTTTLPTKLTLAAFLEQPETKPVSEFTDGTVTQKPTPGGERSLLQDELCATINQVYRTPKASLCLSRTPLYLWRSLHRPRRQCFPLGSHSASTLWSYCQSV